MTCRCRYWLGVVIVGAVSVCLGAARPAWACATCFGDPNSNLSKGVVWGVIVLVGVVISVLSGFVGVGFYWMKRARHLAEQERGSLGSV